ncbi:MAG: polysaccharide biosynthesis protein [Lachnospiraceae bacterium]|jgi:FlaA1/EpsC-like NDP-sugar epimerase|nr:polysaccharide biosynthesis protein [Lachnospiraceae bacterium]MCI9110057.1 polysaccharide biosynthesis protein [Lachnospiraceae bacterium]MCI9343818.1 polysaccharide biosynthesis protein [Lachnospiraceae bacterium]GFH92178.1 UDP-N-acetyl-alpha-D-glucosamine C6 dehydratase [Lachnospiraceae bacterium]
MKKDRNPFNVKLFYRRTCLIVYDIISVIFASYFAVFIRYEFRLGDVPEHFLTPITSFLPINIVLTLFVCYIFRLYHSLWAFAGETELQNLVVSCAVSTILNSIGLQFFKTAGQPVPKSYYFLYLFVLISMMFISRFSYRFMRSLKHKQQNKKNGISVMVIGAGEAANVIIKEIVNSNFSTMVIRCIIDDDKGKWGRYIQGIRVAGGRDKIIECADVYDIDEIIVAMPSISRAELRKILEICKETNCKLRSLPGMYQLVNGEVNVSKLRDVEVEDLLGREPISVDLDSILGYVQSKVVLVTGGGGSIGSELCRQIACHRPRQLIIVDIYENNVYDIQQELKTRYPDLDLAVLIASVRNTNRMNWIFEHYQPDIVYHAAAHKHVPLMEDSPNEAVKNNVFGTWKTAQAAAFYGVKKFVLISTDKAVNPTNIMGASKRICEMIIQTFNNHYDTEFVAVRFGNVLGSNGSVIPLFRKQIVAGGPVTVTHPDIIRYFMTIPEAVSLVLQAGAYAKGGEIFVLDMGEPVKILDLAENLIRLSGYRVGEDIKIEFTGLRPGEKLYEELLMEEEGLKETANRLIHVGKPIEIDETQFFIQLKKLKEESKNESGDIRPLIQEIVPTYHYHR